VGAARQRRERITRQQSTTSTLPSLSSFPGDQAFRLLYVALIVSSTFGVLAFGVPPFATRSPLTSHSLPTFPIFSLPMRFFHVLAAALLL
jgi:hypothetical protein